MPTPLLTASVTIWCAAPIPWLSGQDAWLSDEETSRASTFRRPLDHDRFVTGRLLTRAVLGERLHQPPGDVDLRIGARASATPGRPYVAPGPSFSIAHAGSWVLVAVVDPAGPPQPGPAAATAPGAGSDLGAGVDVGVDVESTAPALAHLADLLDAVPAGEQPPDGWDAESFTRSWVRREAVLKAVGTGLLAPQDDLLLSRADRPARVVHSGGLLPCPDRLVVRDLELPAAWPSPSAVGGGGGTCLAAVALRSARGPVALGSVRVADGATLLARHGIAARTVPGAP